MEPPIEGQTSKVDSASKVSEPRSWFNWRSPIDSLVTAEGLTRIREAMGRTGVLWFFVAVLADIYTIVRPIADLVSYAGLSLLLLVIVVVWRRPDLRPSFATPLLFSIGLIVTGGVLTLSQYAFAEDDTQYRGLLSTNLPWVAGVQAQLFNIQENVASIQKDVSSIRESVNRIETLRIDSDQVFDKLLLEQNSMILKQNSSLYTENSSLREEMQRLRKQFSDAVAAIPSQTEVENASDRIRLAEEMLSLGKVDVAAGLYEEIAQLRISEGKKANGRAAQALRRIGILTFFTDTNRSLTAYEKASALAPKDLDTWNQLGHLYRRVGSLGKAYSAYKQLLVSNDTKDEWRAVAYGNLGNLHGMLGELDAAVEMYEQALVLNMELKSKQGMASSYSNLGVVLDISGQQDEAVKMYEQALALNSDLDRKQDMADVYSNLGVVYKTRGELNSAVEMYEQALALNSELGRKEGMAVQYGNLGNVHRERDELEAAVKMYEKALALNLELGRKEGAAIQYANLGLVHQTRGELAATRAMWERSFSLLEEIRSPTAEILRKRLKLLE